MRKKISVLMAVLLVLGLAACGKTDNPTTETTTQKYHF